VVTNPDAQSGVLADGLTVVPRMVYLPVILR